MTTAIVQTKNENISIARINNLDGYPTWDSSCGYYVLKITFTETDTNALKNLSLFLSNSDMTEAEEMCYFIREKFRKAHLFEGSRVIVFHNKRGIVKGLRVKGRPWFDVINLKKSSLLKIMN